MSDYTAANIHCAQQSPATSLSCCHGYCSGLADVVLSGKSSKYLLVDLWKRAFYESHLLVFKRRQIKKNRVSIRLLQVPRVGLPSLLTNKVVKMFFFRRIWNPQENVVMSDERNLSWEMTLNIKSWVNRGGAAVTSAKTKIVSHISYYGAKCNTSSYFF